MSIDVGTQADPVVDHLDLWSSVTVKKATSGRGSNGKVSAYGVQKLRELILELAVRGDLVPQDPDDEHANVHLKFIGAKKSQLLTDGKIKKPRALPQVNEENYRSDLPKGWDVTQLGIIALVDMGNSPPGSTYNETGEGVPLINGPVEFSKGHFGKILKSKFTTAPNVMCEPGDILVCVRGATTGRTNVADFEACIGRGVARVKSLGFQGYINLLMWENQHRLLAMGTGTTFPSISYKDLAGHVVLLPPLPEQHRIVAKVDELMALCDQLEREQTDSLQAHQTLVETLLRTLVEDGAQMQEEQVSRKTGKPGATAESTQQAWNRIAEHFDTLFTTEESIDQLKQTILQLAVMGKLVPQDPNDEPASVLLEKIAKEKERLVKEGEIKKQKNLPKVSEEEESFKLPDTWEWVRFGLLIKTFTNGLYKKASFYGDDGVISLRMYNIQNGDIVFSDIRRINVNDYELNQYRLVEGDLLINRVNSKELVGKTALIPQYPEPLLFESMNMRARPFSSILISSYLNLYMKTDMAKTILLSHAKEAISQASLNQSQISSLPMPLPPKDEQRRIVAKVDELMAICDTLKVRIQDAQTTQVHLADAVVEEAVG